MSQRDPGGEHVALTSYELRQLKLIEQTLASDDPRSPDGEQAGDAARYPTWIALMVPWSWLALIGVAAGSGFLLVLALGGGAVSAHVHRQRARPDQVESE